MMRRLHTDDRGMGLVTALAIAFVVMSLATIWIVTSYHEIDETEYHEHRTSALNSAEAGARWAMSALAYDLVGAGWIGVDSASNSTTDVSAMGLRSALAANDYVSSGTGGSGLGGTCGLEAHLISANGEQIGEWWARVWTVDAAKYVYQIESWGWSPQTTHRQAANQKVTVQVRLIPAYSGFTNAIFAEANLSGLNRKEIYGDVYAGETATITNYTRIYPNDAGHIGEGRLRVQGDLNLGNGSNNEFYGLVHVQGMVRDDTPGSAFTDLKVLNDATADGTTVWTESDFESATLTGEARFSTNPGHTGDLEPAASVIPGATGLDDVPTITLPQFVWDRNDYDLTEVGTVLEHSTVGDFQTWFAANESALYGVHRVPGPTDLNFTNATLAGDFMVVVEGDVEVRSTPATAPSDEPLDLIVVQSDPAGRLTTANGVIGADGVLHQLMFSNGEFDAANQTVIYGAIYGYEDVSTNRVEVHFRPPEDSLVKGFDFVIPDPDSFIPQPVVWRAVQVAEPTPITDYCGVPGGAAASVPAPSGTTTTTTTVPSTVTTIAVTTTTTPPTTTTSIYTCPTLPNGKCKP